MEIVITLILNLPFLGSFFYQLPSPPPQFLLLPALFLFSCDVFSPRRALSLSFSHWELPKCLLILDYSHPAARGTEELLGNCTGWAVVAPAGVSSLRDKDLCQFVHRQNPSSRNTVWPIVGA